ncbi:MAG: 3-dehydroquinate synthase, partial [Chitinophagaceae bacterium]
MKESVSYRFTNAAVNYYFNARFSALSKLTGKDRTVLITDENVYRNHTSKFRGWNTIVLKPGEEFKVQATVDSIIDQLIAFQADRQFTLIGIGGGVVTDLTGYVASVFMRGVSFGFVPTSLLAMVDASIGGKNGIDVGPYKNMVGVIKQPSFILFDFSFLTTLPDAEWSNGFAEIIKHACILDAAAFRILEKHTLSSLKKDKKTLFGLLERNAKLKSGVVMRDEFEKGERRLLNFGHTLGHALETQYILSHGEAVAIGMTYACHFSEGLLAFTGTERVVNLLSQYGLPTHASFKTEKVFEILKMDKKRVRKEMNYILLEKIGKAV